MKFFEILLKVLKFMVNLCLKILTFMCSTFIFSNTYNIDKYHEDLESLDKPIWK